MTDNLIDGATGPSLTIPAAAETHQLFCDITRTNAQGLSVTRRVLSPSVVAASGGGSETITGSLNFSSKAADTALSTLLADSGTWTWNTGPISAGRMDGVTVSSAPIRARNSQTSGTNSYSLYSFGSQGTTSDKQFVRGSFHVVTQSSASYRAGVFIGGVDDATASAIMLEYDGTNGFRLGLVTGGVRSFPSGVTVRQADGTTAFASPASGRDFTMGLRLDPRAATVTPVINGVAGNPVALSALNPSFSLGTRKGLWLSQAAAASNSTGIHCDKIEVGTYS